MVSIFSISDKIIVGKRVDYLSAYLSESLFKHNFKINEHRCFSTFSDFTNMFSNETDGDIFFILVDKTNIMLNNLLAQKADCVMVDNAYAKNCINEYYRKLNIPATKESEIEWKMPALARAIINPNDIVQGYMMIVNNITYIVLPSNYIHARQMFEDVVLDQLVQMQKKRYKNYTFKTFGLTESNLKEILVQEIKNKDRVSVNLFERDLEVDIVVKAIEDNNELDNIAQKIFMKLSNYIYAVEDIPIVQVAYNLLNMNELKVAFAEDVTAGNICNKLCRQSANAKDLISETIVATSKKSKIDLLKVDAKTIEENGEVSANVAYEMAANLVSSTSANIVVATVGTLNATDKLPMGLSYIAVGDKKEIHVYKNLFKGSTNEIIESITSASYFYLIKKLKKNDFHLEQTTI